MDKEALRQLMALLSDKERHKKILEKLGPDAITLYEGFANEGLVSMYELFNSEYKDKLISLILKELELDMEDYKKKLEQAHKLYYSANLTNEQKYVLESLFPELKESEEENTDEKIRKALQNKPWSEEDEKMCQETIDWFEKKIFPYALEIENPARESIKWLKSLKGRMQPQPRQGWGEEDEDTIKFLISHFCISHCNRNFQFTSNKLITYDELLEKIRNLKHKSTWKPSESDILLLERIANGKSNPQDFQASLESLIGQLKKLKE